MGCNCSGKRRDEGPLMRIEHFEVRPQLRLVSVRVSSFNQRHYIV